MGGEGRDVPGSAGQAPGGALTEARRGVTDADDPAIRVVRVIARLNIGGPAIHVVLATEGLRARGYATTLVVGGIDPHEGDMAYLAAERGVELLVLPELRRGLHPVRDAICLGKLYRMMRRIRPDIVHTHTAKAGFVGRLSARLAGVPVIIHTFHGHVLGGYFGRSTTRIFMVLERWAARWSTAIVTLSDRLRAELVELLHVKRADRLEVIPLGLDLGRFVTAVRGAGVFRREIGVAPEAPLVGIVGRLVPVKNHALLLAAAPRVLAALPEARFVVVGDGELRAGLERQAMRAGLGHAFIFTGWRRDLPDIYGDLDLTVLCSRNEGTPVSLIEALAAGCPVAATDVGGVADLLEDGRWGRLVPRQDPGALAEGILASLRARPDVTSARALMTERYGIDRLVEDLDRFYRRHLHARRPR